MRNFLSLCRQVSLWCGCLAIAASPQVAFAQAEGGAGINAAAAATEPSWVFPYLLMILSTGLALYIMAKPSKRKDPDLKEDGPS